MKKEFDFFLPPYTLEEMNFQINSSQVKDYWHDLVNTNYAFSQTKGEGTVVFVLDTTYKYSHPDLKDNILEQFAKSFTDDTVDNNNQKHGDHVGGIIGGIDNEIGVIGAAPNTKIVYVRVLNKNGSGTSNWIANGIRYVADLDMGEEYKDHKRIINMSLGGPSPIPAVENAMKYANEKGVFILCAAGNSSYTGSDNVGYPGKYDDLCITVSSVGETDGFSNFSSGGVAVDVSAYGERIYSTYGTGYARLSGTSMATPLVAGICALVLSKWGDQIKTIKDLENFLKIHALDKGPIGEDNQYGAGIIRVKPLIDNRPDGTTPPDEPDTPDNPIREMRTITMPFEGKWSLIWNNLTSASQRDFLYDTFVYSDASNLTEYEIFFVKEVVLDYTSNKFAREAFDLVWQNFQWYFTNRGMWMRPNDDYVDVAEWTAYFLEVLLKQRGVVVKVQSLKGTDATGRTVVFNSK